MTFGHGAVLSVCAAAAFAPFAQADIIMNLGGGWQATIFDEDNTDLTVDSVNRNRIVLEKFANFKNTKGLSIAFNQIAPDAQTVSRIVLTDMFIANNSGVDWFDFHEILLGNDAVFDVAASATFSIDPFTQRSYSDGDTQVTFFDGLVPDGTIWTPGLDSGALVINIDLSDDAPAKFILKEIPSVPAPGALIVLAGAGLMSRRRRRD